MLSKAWGLGGHAPPTPPRRYAGQRGCRPDSPLPTAAATLAGGPTAQPPLAPSAWPRAFARAAKSCGARGSHFPGLFDYLNLERNFVSVLIGWKPGKKPLPEHIFVVFR